MSNMEFDLIYRHFATLGHTRTDTILSVGDDAALLAPDTGSGIVLTHAILQIEPDEPLDGERAAHELYDSCANALSDDAHIHWALLALTSDSSSRPWLRAFAAGLDHVLRQHQVQLVGGDTTSGAAAAELICVAVTDA
jgi:thiamine-monophosphate kinase